MNSEKYFAELSRVLAKEDIKTASPENGRLPILLDGQPIGRVEPSGTMCLAPGDVTTPDANDLYQQAKEIAGVVHEYLTEMENGSPMLVGGDSYSKLCEFNHAVLGGREMTNGEYQFATWLRENDGSLCSGNYCGENYIGAKENFAERADLVPHDRLFSKEQLVEMYRCMADTLDNEYELTDAQTKLIEETQKQIERTVPDLQERVAQALEQFEQTMQFGE